MLTLIITWLDWLIVMLPFQYSMENDLRIGWRVEMSM